MKPKYFFWIIFCATLYLIFMLYKPFLMNLVIALLLCVSTFGLKKQINERIKYNLLSSAATLVVFIACVIIPLAFVSIEAFGALSAIDFAKYSDFIKESQTQIAQLLAQLPDSLQAQINQSAGELNLALIFARAVGLSKTIGAASVSFITDCVFILIFLYLFYYYGDFLRDYIIDMIPFKASESKEILGEVSGVLRVVFFTTIISMILQGASFGIVISFFGFSGMLFGVLYGVASIIPIVGGALVWLPVALYIYWLGDLKSAIFVALYSLIFIGFFIDNVIKPVLIAFVNKIFLQKPVRVNEMIIFISLLAGLASFGFWGVIIGPTITAFFIALLRTYRNKFKEGESEC